MESELLKQRIHLYLYGELSLAERQEVERCRDEDPAFRALFENERRFLLALGEKPSEDEIGPLLGECREALLRAVAAEPRAARDMSLLGRARSRLDRLWQAAAARPLLWQPAAAALLVLVGFAFGRGSTPGPGLPTAGEFPAMAHGSQPGSGLQPVLTGIETVRLDPAAGQVQIVLEERRVVTGAASDPVIRDMLLQTVRDSHAGARLSSLEALREHAAETDVRQMLLHSMTEDEHPGVRLIALDAVRDHVRHTDVRDALVRTLRQDPNAAMRVHAIQLLREFPSRDQAGQLLDLINSETNPFVVQQIEEILDDLDAAVEHY